MKHTHHLGDDGQTLGRHLEPGVEGRDQLRSDVLARVRKEVVKRAEQDLPRN